MEKPSTPAPEKQVTSRPQTSRARAASLPEVDLYIHLILLLYLIDQNALKAVRLNSLISIIIFSISGTRLCQTING